MATHFLSNAVETLDRVPPPAPKQTSEPLRYTSFSKAFNRMMALQRTLGITEPEQKVFNVGKLNARIIELESMLTAKSAPKAAGEASEKSVFDLGLPEIRQRCLALEAELGVLHAPTSENLILARSRLCELQSEKTLRASRKILASLPAAPSATFVPAAPEPAKDVEPELKGRARFVAAARIQGTETSTAQVLAQGLHGVDLVKAAMRLDGKPVTMPASANQEASEYRFTSVATWMQEIFRLENAAGVAHCQTIGNPKTAHARIAYLQGLTDRKKSDIRK